MNKYEDTEKKTITTTSTTTKVAPMRMCDLLKFIEQENDEDEVDLPPLVVVQQSSSSSPPPIITYKVNTPGPRAVGNTRYTTPHKTTTTLSGSKLPKLCTGTGAGRTPKITPNRPNSGKKTYSYARSTPKCALFADFKPQQEVQITPLKPYKKTEMHFENPNSIETNLNHHIESHDISEKLNKPLSCLNDSSFQHGVANISSNTILKNIRDGNYITPLKVSSGYHPKDETPITQSSKVASLKKPRIPLYPLSTFDPALNTNEKKLSVLAVNNKENILPNEDFEVPGKALSPPQDVTEKTSNNTADTLSSLLQGMKIGTPWKGDKPPNVEENVQHSTENKSAQRKLYNSNQGNGDSNKQSNFLKPQPPAPVPTRSVPEPHIRPSHIPTESHIPKPEHPKVVYQCKPVINSQIQDLDKVAASLTEDVAKKANENNGKQFRCLSIKGKQYTIMTKLGVGGSSEVFKVMDMDTSAMFAVKCVNLAVDPALAKGYINEIRLLQQLQGSDRVITMDGYEYIKDRKMLYVKLEMGEIDLSSLMKSYKARNQKLPLPILVGYWTEMLSAVNYIHSKGVIHSDLKPANFLLVRGRLKLIDFGIASSLTSDATSIYKDSTAGTLNYISPEAVMGGCGGREPVKISYKSDVWSLGCILYSMIYGRTPFNDVPHISMKMAMLCNPNQVIDYPAIPGIPPVLIHAMKWCLTFDPKKRPTVQQLIDLPYINRSEVNGNSAPGLQIPTPILLKIKNILSDEEWRFLIESQTRNVR